METTHPTYPLHPVSKKKQSAIPRPEGRGSESCRDLLDRHVVRCFDIALEKYFRDTCYIQLFIWVMRATLPSVSQITQPTYDMKKTSIYIAVAILAGTPNILNAGETKPSETLVLPSLKTDQSKTPQSIPAYPFAPSDSIGAFPFFRLWLGVRRSPVSSKSLPASGDRVAFCLAPRVLAAPSLRSS